MSDAEVMAAKVDALRDDMAEVKGTLRTVAAALERLARLEERHTTTAGALDRAFSAITKLGERVAALEQAQPVQRLTSGWVVNAAWGAGGMLAMLVARKVGLM